MFRWTRAFCVLWLGLWCLSPGVAAAAQVRIAVLEFRGTLAPSEMRLVSDKVRAGVIGASEGRDVVVMSREGMDAIAKDMGIDLASCEGECEVETGRNLGAHFVITGEVSEIGGTLVCTIKAHETENGGQVGFADARHAEVIGLVDLLPALARGLTRSALAPVGRRSLTELDLGDRIENRIVDETGFLTVTVRPEGAQVLLNGVDIGRGGVVEKETMVGRYVVAADHPGLYHPFVSAEFELGTDGVRLDIVLKPASGVLTVTSEPTDAEVWIGGKKVGRTPYTDPAFPSGEVELRVSKAHHLTATQVAVVRDEQITQLPVTLAPNFGGLSVESTPPGAAIFFGETSTGRHTPHTFPQLPPGPRTVRLSLEGYLAHAARVEVGNQERVAHRVTLEPMVGLLVIQATGLDGQPCQGEVRLDGERVGQTPYKAPHPVGAHSLTVACDDGRVARTFEIQHNERTEIKLSIRERLGTLKIRVLDAYGKDRAVDIQVNGEIHPRAERRDGVWTVTAQPGTAQVRVGDHTKRVRVGEAVEVAVVIPSRKGAVVLSIGGPGAKLTGGPRNNIRIDGQPVGVGRHILRAGRHRITVGEGNSGSLLVRPSVVQEVNIGDNRRYYRGFIWDRYKRVGADRIRLKAKHRRVRKACNGVLLMSTYSWKAHRIETSAGRWDYSNGGGRYIAPTYQNVGAGSRDVATGCNGATLWKVREDFPISRLSAGSIVKVRSVEARTKSKGVPRSRWGGLGPGDYLCLGSGRSGSSCLVLVDARYDSEVKTMRLVGQAWAAAKYDTLADQLRALSEAAD